MDAPEILLILILYTLFVALIALIFFQVRRRRASDDGPPIPEVAALELKPVKEPVVVPLERAQALGSDAGPAEAPPIAALPADRARPGGVEQPAAGAIAAGNNGALSAPLSETALIRALSEIFEKSGPLLPERIRTLEVTPNRAVEPGSSVNAAFTFRNLGGATASGFRVRFCLPEGLTYAPGTARIDETFLADVAGVTPLLAGPGAEIGDIPAGGERRVMLSFTVADTIENGTVMALQAAVASADFPVIGSNIVRLVARSLPVLQNERTGLLLAAVLEALPGYELQLMARVHNSGRSSAHDVVVLLGLPSNTTFVPSSVTIDGRATAGSETFPFGFTRPAVVAPILTPGSTIDVGYRVRIGSPLEDGTSIIAHGAVCSQEIAEFALSPATVVVSSAVSFGSDETSFGVDCGAEIESGEPVRFVLRAMNVGSAVAHKISLAIALPPGMLYTPGSLCVNGAPASGGAIAPESVALGDLEPGHSVELALSAIVRSPIPNGRRLRATATVAWSGAQRHFEQTLTARSAPSFPVEYNKLESDMVRAVGPGETVTYTITVKNTGTDVATNARLALAADPGLEQVRVRDGKTELPADGDGMLVLGLLEPGVVRSFRVDARVARIIEDQTALRLAAMLSTAQIAQVELGTRVTIVESGPMFSLASSHITDESDHGLRFKQLSTLRVAITNEGTDEARDVHVLLTLPAELRLEEVLGGAKRVGNSIAFGNVAVGATSEVQFNVRLIGMIWGGEPVRISGRVSGHNVVPLGLRPIELTTHPGASFGENAILLSAPNETVDAGAEIEYALLLRNSGNSAAKNLTARIAGLSNAMYAQGSTIINGLALADNAGTSLLLSDGGLRLADVGPGVEIVARWRAVVNMPLPSTATVEARAFVSWDDDPEITVVATPIKVRSTAALPINHPDLPFSVLGAVAAPARAIAPAVQPQRALRLPPAALGWGTIDRVFADSYEAAPPRTIARKVLTTNGEHRRIAGNEGDTAVYDHSV